jgi:D-alanyl-D-alanine carboxypeptidase
MPRIIMGLILATLLCSPASAAPDGAALDAALEQLRREHLMPGITAAVVYPDGRLIAAAAGSTVGADARALTPDDRMLTGSIGKTFVAALMLDVCLQRGLSLDTPVSRWFAGEPWFARLPNARDITVRMLLNHSSGVPDHVEDPRFLAAVKDGTAPLAHLALLDFVLDRPPLFSAGKGTQYTDTGYILLGLLLEKITGASYESLLRARLLEPLQLRATQPSDRRDLPGLVAGEATTPLGGDVHPAVEWTGGGLVSTSRDLARWAWLLYQGRALEHPYLPLMLADSGLGDARGRYGLGVFIRQREGGDVYGHAGWFPGYRSLMLYLPAERVSIALQVNSDAPRDLAACAFELLAALGIAD